MNSVVETKFKNSSLNLVQAFGRTGGMHHPCSSPNAGNRDQIDGFKSVFVDSLHHATPLHPTGLLSTEISRGIDPKRCIDRRHPGSKAPVAMPRCTLLWRGQASRPTDPTPRRTPSHSPLLLLDTPRSPRMRALPALVRARAPPKPPRSAPRSSPPAELAPRRHPLPTLLLAIPTP